MSQWISDQIGSSPKFHTRAVTLALRHALHDANVWQVGWTVACSGGPDSLALTFAVADLAHRKSVPLRVLIINHNLRAEARQETEHTRDLLAEWGVGAQVVDVSVDGTGGVEAAAREARYQALRAHTPAGSAIFLGHTMDDQAETVLLGLGRGSGTRSLSGMRGLIVDTHTWVRPLLSVRRCDTEGMCAELGLTPIHDPSNNFEGGWVSAEGQPLPRVAVRHRVIPELSSALSRDVVPLLARSAQLLHEDASALEAAASQASRGASRSDRNDPRSRSFSIEALAQLDQAVRSRVLMDAALQIGAGTLEAVHVRALDRLVTDFQGGGPLHLPNGVRAWREKVTTVRGSQRQTVRVLRLRANSDGK